MTEDPGASADEARALAASLQRLLRWVNASGGEGAGNEVAALVTGFLGEAGSAHSVVTRQLAPFDHVNLQTALLAWMSEARRKVDVHGIALPPNWGGVSLLQILGGEGLPPIRLSAPPLVDLPNGPASTVACFTSALLLVTDAAGRYGILITGPSEHDANLRVEIAGLPVEAAQAVQGRLDQLRHELNVYRGRLIDVALSPHGAMMLSFAAPPETGRADVILPDAVLGRIERHALGVADHREALRAAGQHLKRGLLLYGPPGTGKTHTTRYLVGAMDGYTRLVMTGQALRAIGAAAELARDLAPAVIVLEDVDLVAEDRSYGPGSSPVLFDLLDAMDGAAADADLLFLLTTNRADLLEPALAARPGRVDVAVEIDLPDGEGRRRLLALYAQSLSLALTSEETEQVVTRTEGVTASFIKELLRRAVLESLHGGGDGTQISAAHVSAALDDLLDSTQAVTRSLLGVGTDPESLPAGGGVGGLPMHRGALMRGRRTYR